MFLTKSFPNYLSLGREGILVHQQRRKLAKHYGDCLRGTDNCFSCGNRRHKVQDFPNMKGQDNGIRQSSGSNVDPLKKNHFDALRPSGEQNSSSDVVTNMLQVFTIDLYDLLYLGTTLSFFNLSSS